ncbi:MAG TPA: hypothetical protein VFJ29_07485, partial [Candidatus Kapabacteria bacterium]|nr:hypothetical protein [Candidatus Kapabacteria bacterium]
ENPSLKSYIDLRFSPRELMIELYGKRGEYADALALLDTMLEQARQYPKQQELIRQKMYELQIKDLEKQKKYADAMNIAKNALTSITDTLDQSSLISRKNLELLMTELCRKAGLPMQSDSTAH